MGRHGRDSDRAAPAAGHRGTRRRNPAARTGLLGASAAVAVGAVAVVTGILPAPGHLAGGDPAWGGPGGGNLSRADGTPSALAQDPGGSATPAASDAARGGAGQASARPSPSRTAPHPSATPSRKPAAPATTAPPRPADTPTTAAPAAPALTGGAAAQAAEVLTLVNQQRAQAGCRPLTADARLAELAGNFSAEMAARGFFDHTDPDGRSPWDRAAALGITNLGGENIAEGQADAQAVMTAWMNSPGHRANILDCDYHTIGIGLHYATGSESGGPWWTQDFGY